MAFYSVFVSNTAQSITNDFMTFVTLASRRLKIHEISIGGMGNTSVANELRLYRSTVGTTPGGALTPSPFVTDSPAATTVVDTTWVAQPTAGVSLLTLPWNANGGIYRWVAKPGEEPEARNAEQLSLRGAVGTSVASLHVVFEEM